MVVGGRPNLVLGPFGPDLDLTWDLDLDLSLTILIDISKLLDLFQVDGDLRLASDAALHSPSSHHLQVNTSFYN